MHSEVVPYLGYDPMPLAQFEPIYRQLLAGEFFDVCEVDGRIVGFCKAMVTMVPSETAATAMYRRGAGSPSWGA